MRGQRDAARREPGRFCEINLDRVLLVVRHQPGEGSRPPHHLYGPIGVSQYPTPRVPRPPAMSLAGPGQAKPHRGVRHRPHPRYHLMCPPEARSRRRAGGRVATPGRNFEEAHSTTGAHPAGSAGAPGRVEAATVATALRKDVGRRSTSRPPATRRQPVPPQLSRVRVRCRRAARAERTHRRRCWGGPRRYVRQGLPG